MICLEAAKTNFIVFGLTQTGLEPTIYTTNRAQTHDLHDKQGSNPRSTQLDHDVNMLTITPRQFTTDEIPHACSYHHNMDNIIILHVQVCHGLFCGQ
jgi:hypothetical protein